MLFRTRLRYPAIFSIDGEPAIDSGGVTNEVVSLALNSSSVELDTLMSYYENSQESETFAPLGLFSVLFWNHFL